MYSLWRENFGRIGDSLLSSAVTFASSRGLRRRCPLFQQDWRLVTLILNCGDFSVSSVDCGWMGSAGVVRKQTPFGGLRRHDHDRCALFQNRGILYLFFLFPWILGPSPWHHIPRTVTSMMVTDIPVYDYAQSRLYAPSFLVVGA
jgi:hypothetical protein